MNGKPKFLSIVAFVLVMLTAKWGFGERILPPASEKTPAEQKMEDARNLIRTNPSSAEARNALALALTRRARETSDPEYYELATKELQESVRIDPDNFDARKIETWVALGKHEFSKALELSRALSKRRPDDVLAYALLTDACIETGNYEEAEKAAQWALDMRPGDIPGLTRAAYLRELFGDISGAAELMSSAYNKTAPSEVEDRAWILTQFAHLQILDGKPDVAELALVDALKLFPDYHYALGNLVKVRTAQNRLEEALKMARKFYETSPHPENLFVLGEALSRAGKLDEAKTVFTEFETKALEESEGADNANRELVFFYVDHANRPAEALRVATMEMNRRQDIFTRHAFAWALQANGELARASEEIGKALSVGIRHPTLFYHAGMIALKKGDRDEANRHFQASLEQAERSEVADLARRAIKE